MALAAKSGLFRLPLTGFITVPQRIMKCVFFARYCRVQLIPHIKYRENSDWYHGICEYYSTYEFW